MNDLPLEIVADILSRLPIESLCEAKYVSKIWNSIVKTTSFVTKHLSYNNNKPTLILRLAELRFFPVDLFLVDTVDPEPHVLPLRSNLFNVNCSVRGSTNGILCYVGPSRCGFPTHLSNPVLNQYITLPPSNICPQRHGYCSIIGFACDPSTGDYKVVRFFRKTKQAILCDEDFNTAYVSEIYTFNLKGGYNSASGSWRRIRNPPYVLEYSAGCFLNGNLHWLAYSDYHSESIVFFDVHNEEFGVLPAPKPLDRSGFCLGVLGEHLCMFNRCFEEYLDVWVMKEYGKGESWVIEHRITKDSYDDFVEVNFICMLEDGKILIPFVGGYFNYDPWNDVLDKYYFPGGDYQSRLPFRRIKPIPHTCSIISFKGAQARCPRREKLKNDMLGP